MKNLMNRLEVEGWISEDSERSANDFVKRLAEEVYKVVKKELEYNMSGYEIDKSCVVAIANCAIDEYYESEYWN